MKIKHYVVGPLQVNCYMFLCEKTGHAAIIDPGWPTEALYEERVVAAGKNIASLATHCHFDHIGGAAQLSDITNSSLQIHPLEQSNITDAHNHASRWGFRIEPVSRYECSLEHGDRISVGQIDVEVLHTPGHSSGSTCFLVRDEGVMFTGDLIMRGGVGRTDFTGGDWQTLVTSIRDHVFSLPDSFELYPGHGPNSTVGYEKQFNPFLRNLHA
ncbi:MAG: MBL fold metallo-hydrolase [Chloroflexota bacterium]